MAPRFVAPSVGGRQGRVPVRTVLGCHVEFTACATVLQSANCGRAEPQGAVTKEGWSEPSLLPTSQSSRGQAGGIADAAVGQKWIPRRRQVGVNTVILRRFDQVRDPIILPGLIELEAPSCAEAP